MKALQRLWAEQRWPLVAFLLALSLSGFFGGRMVTRALFWADPAHRQQAPEGWMTPGYLARSWHVSIDEIEAILGIEDGRKLVGDSKPTLENIAKALNLPLADLTGRLQAQLPALAKPEDAAP